MCALPQCDGPLDPQVLQIAIQRPQSILGFIPASALINGDVDIVNPKVFHQVKYGFVPIALQDPRVVPMDTGDEDLLIAYVGNRFLACLLAKLGGYQGVQIDQA